MPYTFRKEPLILSGAVQAAYGVIAASEGTDPLLSRLKEAVDSLNGLKTLIISIFTYIP